MALKGKSLLETYQYQQGILYFAGPKLQGMPFSGMIKLKLKFFKTMQNKIPKKYQFYFFILEYFFFKKRLHDTKHFNSEKKEQEGRRKRKREKEN